jgi:hypothetical protein
MHVIWHSVHFKIHVHVSGWIKCYTRTFWSEITVTSRTTIKTRSFWITCTPYSAYAIPLVNSGSCCCGWLYIVHHYLLRSSAGPYVQYTTLALVLLPLASRLTCFFLAIVLKTFFCKFKPVTFAIRKYVRVHTDKVIYIFYYNHQDWLFILHLYACYMT